MMGGQPLSSPLKMFIMIELRTLLEPFNFFNLYLNSIELKPLFNKQNETSWIEPTLGMQ